MARTPLNTQGQNLIVRTGDTIQGEDNAAGAGSTLALKGGDSTGGGGAGADVTIDGGTPDTAGAGGSVLIAATAGDGAGAGGSLNLLSGSSPSGTQGDIVLRSSLHPAPLALDGGVYVAAADDAAGVGGALLQLSSGFAGKPGAAALFGGSGLAGTTPGSDVNLQGGDGFGVAPGGSVQIQGGSSGSDPSSGGNINITGGIPSTNGAGGTVTIQSSGSPAGSGGDVILKVSSATTPVQPVDGTIQAIAATTVNVVTGANLILRKGGSGTFFGSGGYGASLIGGSAISASGAAGDDVQITAGAGDLAGDGGWAAVQAGNSGVTPGAVAGSVYIAAGSNTGSQNVDDQGAVDILAGNVGALSFKPGRVLLKASDDTVLGTGSSITVGPPDGAAPAAGSVSITGGSGLLANAGGSVALNSGSSATGSNGDILLRGANVPAPPALNGGIYAAATPDPSGVLGAGLVLFSGLFGGNNGSTELAAGNAVAGNTDGGSATFRAGLGFGTGGGGPLEISAGNAGGGVTGDGGKVSIIAGLTTGSGDGGNVEVTAGSSVGGIQGDILLLGGLASNPGALDGGIAASASPNATAGLGGAFFQLNSGFASKPGIAALFGGDGLSGNNPGALVSIGGGAGIGAAGGGDVFLDGGNSGNGLTGGGGPVNISAGNALSTNGDGGAVNISGGGTNGGTPGDVNLLALGGTVNVFTQQVGFTGTDRVTQTYGVQTSVPAGTVIAVLGTLDTDGRNMKITVDASGVNVADNTDHLSAYIVQTFYRAGGTVSALTAHVDDNQDTGAWPNVISPLFALVINGNDIELQWTWNGIQAAAVTVNIAVTWVRQEGGFAS